MPLRKAPHADLKKQYPLAVQAGIALALLVVFGAAALPLTSEPAVEVAVYEPETVHLVDVPPTNPTTPPPPPAPPPPVEVADHVDVEEFTLDDLTLETEIRRAVPPPAPIRQDPPAAPVLDVPPPQPEVEEVPEVVDFVVVEQMPELIGGLEALQRSIRYPEMCRRAGIEGRVYVQFVVSETGAVENARVARGIGGGCDEVALQAVQNARFRPGMQRGRAVRVQFSLPVTFRLR